MLCMNIVSVEEEEAPAVAEECFPGMMRMTAMDQQKWGWSREQMLKPEMNIISRHLLPSTHGYIFYLLPHVQPAPRKTALIQQSVLVKDTQRQRMAVTTVFSLEKAKEQAVESVIAKVEEGLSLRLGNNLWRYGLRGADKQTRKTKEGWQRKQEQKDSTWSTA